MVRTEFTVFYDGSLWIGIIERIEDGKMYLGRTVFGAEPGNAELLEFMANGYHRVPVFPADASGHGASERARDVSFKRAARMARRQMDHDPGSTRAQERYSEALSRSRQEQAKERGRLRESTAEERFRTRQKKRKQKRRGR